MPLIRKFAVQGHHVPATATYARGPFPPELFAPNPRAYEEFRGDSIHEALDDIRYFRCKDCHEVMPGDELDDHVCEEDTGYYEYDRNRYE